MRLAVATILLLIAPPVAAQTAVPSAGTNDPAHDPACANVRVAFPSELAGWSKQMPVAAGVEAGGGASLTVGQAVLVSLHPAKHLKLNPAPKVLAPNGGTLTLAITEPGTYRVSLGGKAWIDLVRGGTLLSSTAHGHGPKCTGVRKMVDFALTPGNYTVQLSGSDAESIALLVAKVA